MGTNVKIVPNFPGYYELMKDPKIQSLLMEYAQSGASAAGSGFEAEIHTGQKRAYANIRAVSDKAIRRNLKENTLVKVLGGMIK